MIIQLIFVYQFIGGYLINSARSVRKTVNVDYHSASDYNKLSMDTSRQILQETTVSQFKQQLDELMNLLEETNPWFVR